MQRKILVVTSSEEPNIKRVMPFLEETNETVVRIDVDRFLETAVFDFRVGQTSTGWTIESSGRYISDHEIKSIWYRRPPSPQPPLNVPARYHDFVRLETRNALWSLWTSINYQTILWVNHPLRLYLLEFNKPYQLLMATQCGLPIPETLITTNPEIALAFSRKWETVVIKTFGGYVLKDVEGKDLSIYTNRVSKQQFEAHRDEIAHAPVMLQNYIPKHLEMRVTVVGKQIFACAINSQDSPLTKDDWRRYDFERVRHEPFTLPADIQLKLLELMRRLKLQFGAIDMVLTPKGKYVFLEVNPSGQWGWIEALTGMPISKAIADLLVRPQELAL